jgi:transcriptional regulator with XRE-family HTH domain
MDTQRTKQLLFYLQAARRKAGLSQDQMAKVLGISAQYMALTEQGRVPWTKDRLEKYCEAVGFTLLAGDTAHLRISDGRRGPKPRPRVTVDLSEQQMHRAKTMAMAVGVTVEDLLKGLVDDAWAECGGA